MSGEVDSSQRLQKGTWPADILTSTPEEALEEARTQILLYSLQRECGSAAALDLAQ